MHRKRWQLRAMSVMAAAAARAEYVLAIAMVIKDYWIGWRLWSSNKFTFENSECFTNKVACCSLLFSSISSNTLFVKTLKNTVKSFEHISFTCIHIHDVVANHECIDPQCHLAGPLLCPSSTCGITPFQPYAQTCSHACTYSRTHVCTHIDMSMYIVRYRYTSAYAHKRMHAYINVRIMYMHGCIKIDLQST